MKARHFAPREKRLAVCRSVAERGGYSSDAANELGMEVCTLRAWLRIHDPETLARLRKRVQGGTTISKARARARIEVCERIAAEGGTIRDASGALDTITPNGLYCWLRDYAPGTLRKICGKKGDKGSNFQIRGPIAARRIKLIKELGYTLAAKRLGLDPKTGRNTLYNWLYYRRKLGCL